MKVLVIGSGGREHAICWKIAQSERVNNIFAIPGNGGMVQLAECVDIKVDNLDNIVNFAKEKKIDITVVGPEAPLAAGIVNRFNQKGLRIFGPDIKMAKLESSKVFAKETMARFRMPTANFMIFDNPDDAKEHIDERGTPLVVKADGLAAGKGVIICKNKKQALDAIKMIMIDKKFGPSGDRVVIEDCLVGEEASIIIISDGMHFVSLASSQDHKQIYDGDKGPNCYSEDTEILTKDGWKKFNMLKKDEEVAVFEPNSRKIYFEEPLKKYWMKYKGPMVQFQHRNIDLLVTPNHRMLLQQRKDKKRVFIKEARNYTGENYIYQSGVWNGKNAKFFVLPEYDYKFNRKFKKLKINFIDWVKFLGIYLAEGYVTKTKGSKRVYIAQCKKSKNFNRIKKIINKLPFKFSHNPKRHTFRINSTQLATYLRRFGTAHNKYAPDYIKNTKNKIIMEFLKAFNLGDGDIHNGRMRFFSSSKRLIDDIQEMMIKLDYSGIIVTDKRKTMLNPLNKKIYKANPVYSIEMKGRNKTSIRKYNIRSIDYDGMIGCVTVSTGFVVVRRNNRVAISGNTGGMGAYSPAPVIDDEMNNRIQEKIIKPLIFGLHEEGTPFKGVLYAGLMITKEGPKVLEFNVRFGDPETQAIFPRLKTDLMDAIEASIDGNIEDVKLEWDQRPCVCVVCASEGYPGSYKKGLPITGLEEAGSLDDVVVFHAGTKQTRYDIQDTRYETNGGRVLGVTASGKDIKDAIDRAYQACRKISFEGIYYRKDIGYRALERYKIRSAYG